MAISESASSATIGTTERYLVSDSTTPTWQTDDGFVSCYLDITNVNGSDEFLLTFYERARSGGSSVAVHEYHIYGGTKGQDVYVTPPVLVMHGWEFGLRRLAGSDRTIGWSVRRVPGLR